MFLEIISPDKKIFSGTVKSIVVPGSDGSLGILENHAPLIASLKKGFVAITEENEQRQTFNIKGGVIEVLKNKVVVLAE